MALYPYGKGADTLRLICRCPVKRSGGVAAKIGVAERVGLSGVSANSQGGSHSFLICLNSFAGLSLEYSAVNLYCFCPLKTP